MDFRSTRDFGVKKVDNSEQREIRVWRDYQSQDTIITRSTKEWVM
jgi:hypothetical protein